MEHIRMITQRPSNGYDWLYEDRENNDRYFTTIVVRPEGTHLWAECTDVEKIQWEGRHKTETEETVGQ